MIWNLIYWVLVVLAIVVGLRGLFWDRAGFRGRSALRCRKCWYDLSGSPGDIEDGPIVCSECGKKHVSRRAMGKTRRSKKWIMAALVLLVLSQSVRVTPKVKKYGRWAVVPNWVLILSIHQIPIFVQNPDIEWEGLSYGRSSPFQRAMGNLQWQARDGELSWFDYQLVAWLARTESGQSLCAYAGGRKNGAYSRAIAYKSLIRSGIGRGKLGEYHVRWYRRLVSVQVDTRKAWPSGYRVFGQPKIFSTFQMNAEAIHLRVRLHDSINGTSIFSPSTTRPKRIGELDRRGLRYNSYRFGTPVLLAAGAWDDGMIELKPRDPSDDFADLQVTVSEYLGEGRVLGEPETVVDRFELSVPIQRVESVQEFVTIVSNEDVLREIERCIGAQGYWWYDMDGRRRIVLSLVLKENPRIQRRRYTFGDDLIGAWGGGGGSLHGEAWWALEPAVDGGWQLVHGGKLVPMHGGASEQSLLASRDHLWKVQVSSDPEFCLRDFDATHIIDGRLSFETSWTMMPPSGW